MTKITKRNEKLTKREIIRRMAERTRKNNGQYHARKYAFSYVARRIGFEGQIAKMIQFMGWMRDNQNVQFSISGKNIVFA